jgi:subtilisin family serine protease
VKYAQLEVPFQAIYNTQGIVKYSAVKFIVKTQSQNIKISAIDNKDKSYGALSDFYTQSFIDTIKTKVGLTNSDINKITVSKFYNFYTKDSFSISRQNTLIHVPKFWTSLIWNVPYNLEKVILTPDSLISSLLKIPQFIESAERNYYFQLASGGTPNDPDYTNYQTGLRPTPLTASGDINVESAWTRGAIGKDSVYVGIIDGGVDKTHQDLQSNFKRGYYLNKNMPSFAPYDKSGHGTLVAGIIGAARNNSKGGAGIAGGDIATAKKGVSIFDFNAAYTLNSVPTFLDAAYVYNLIAEASYYAGDTNSIGCHVLNNSYIFSTDSAYTLPLGQLRRAIEFANISGTVFVCAKDNNSSYSNAFPSSFPKDNLMIRVGASDKDGKKLASSSFYYPLDFVAPGQTNMYRSTVASSISGNDSTYASNLEGTSFATAHVSGAAALILSYVNKAYKAHDNLAPEDVKYLLTKSVQDIPPAGKDPSTGYGLIDVDGALSKIDPTQFKILHFETAINDPHNVTLRGGGFSSIGGYWFNMYPDNSFTDAFNTFSVPNGKFNAEETELGVTHYHTIPSGYTVVDAWVRNSASSGLSQQLTTEYNPAVFNPFIYDSYDDQAQLETNIQLVSFDAASVTLKGYYYHVLHNSMDSTQNLNFWIPMNPVTYSQFNSYIKAPMAYSVLVTGSPNGVKEESKSNADCIIYPIPTSSLLKVKLLEDASNVNKLTLYNMLGEVVLEKEFTGNLLETNISGINAGAYVAKVSTENQLTTKRITLLK